MLGAMFAAILTWASIFSNGEAVAGPSLVESPETTFPFASFRDIPGVTDEEIAAVEALKNEFASFAYWMPPSTEAFINEAGVIQGFSALLCQWLTEVFGMPFVLSLFEWPELLDRLEDGAADFTGEMRATDERRKTYFMTNAIAERVLKRYRLADIPPLEETAKKRPLRYAWIEGSASTVLDYLAPDTYEMRYVGHINQVPGLLRSGELDVFIHSNAGEANFIECDDIVADYLLPVIHSPVSLATRKAKLAPVISVVQKALQVDGARAYLAELYKAGFADYRRHLLLRHLTAEERAYIQNYPVVKYIAENNRYPVSFYDAYTKEWQGIAADTLKEVTELTGLTFKIVNDNRTTWPEMLSMLDNGEASMISELIPYPARKGRFFWPGNAVMTEHYALLSKADYPNLTLHEVVNARVGLLRGTLYVTMFNTWFPSHGQTVEYDSFDEAVAALDNNEIDLIMACESRVLYLTNYHERPDFKANIVFDMSFPSVFGFNKNEEILCSIVDKALGQIDTAGIAKNWMNKNYNYQAKLMQAQRPWLVGAIILSVCVLCLLLALFLVKRREGQKLKRLVAGRTIELERQSLQLIEAEREARSGSTAKSNFIANMSHEMRTPMNVVVGLTGLMLEDNIPDDIKDTLRKINIAGNTLMGLISNVLDISKIEAGKLELSPVQYDMASLLNDVITLNMIRIEDKPISFKLDVHQDLPRSLFGDDQHIKQILNNLLSNAFKYTKAGSVVLGVTSRREGDDVLLYFYISDTGIGIRQEDMAKLFVDFSQVDTRANRAIEGTGLGLSLTKKFVELMGGEISAESEYGQGSTFRVRIRQGFVTEERINEETLEKLRGFRYADLKMREHEKLARPDLSYARVLVVDDFPTNLDVAASLLRKYKLLVDCVSCGRDAVDRIAAGEPLYDTVFMDHMMPELDGLEATRLIRALGTSYAKNLPIIALTANAVAGNEQMFLENGFNAFLPKPFNATTLDAIVQRWVRDKSRER
jgi:signal transduction histidine kinase